MTITRMFLRQLRIPLVFMMMCGHVYAATPFWGARESLPADTPASSLRPGQFVWAGDAAPEGPIVVVVSVTEQLAFVYRNGIRIGVSTVSTGKAGHDTPTGVFTILQKDKDHHSNVYNNAAMPYTERLTWGGVALHAGGLPGYPSSHGCVHMPSEFARRLFEVSPMGMTVVVASDHTSPEQIAYPSVLSPVDPKTGAPIEYTTLEPSREFSWQPELMATGPVTILMSSADHRVLVFRNGVEIGRARLELRQGEVLGTRAFVLLKGTGSGPNVLLPDEPNPHWMSLALPGEGNAAGLPPDPEIVAGIRLPPQFLRDVYGVITPGTTLVVTDASVSDATTGRRLEVLNGDKPPGSKL
jgi:L,D-transpeptidase catalytic domain